MDERAVEVVLITEGSDGLCAGRTAADNELFGTAGCKVEQREDEERDRQQNDCQGDEAPENERDDGRAHKGRASVSVTRP